MTQKEYEQFIDRTIKNTQSAFDSVIRRLVSMVSGASRGTGSEYLNVTIAEDTAQTLINDAGYSSTVSEFLNSGYGAAVNNTSDFLKARLGGAFRFSDESLAILESVREVDLMQFGQINDDLRTRVARGFTDWAQGGISREDLIRQISEQGSIINDRYLKTNVDTAFSAYNQKVSEKMAVDAGFTKFQYIGPFDGIIRDFCKHVLRGDYGEPIKTIEEWNQLNNVPSRKGQPSPVSSFKGGWNCRHLLVAVE